ncbi:MAG TPA: low-specificity L-threonine aldolase [Vicinamibacterales bacterium]|jgi:threonine aldolase|nr:low-specificity L-threonine aldolase [Vicinamibacterales bacterium]HJN45067.1 low-specificity L-threonine aldolase [Vicinamibacterales bacterium]|tara:strand:- start:475 stop:1488 length:1014 start_codon:yes stop_codon:yes gene_type:complete
MIDLRSDTVTQPTAAMRTTMAQAPVGDDVWGEDPTVARLQERAADLLGKSAALFVPSGTMANQIALLSHCDRADEVFVGEGNHTVFYESGAGPAWAGVSFSVVGRDGLFTAEQLVETIRPRDQHFPRPRLVAIENTHNRSGGRVFPQCDVDAIAEAAHARALSVHLDGARIWNASVATGRPPATLCEPVDSVCACFSKGLGAPVGSVLAGDTDFIARAHRYRKMLGGGMRQAGILAGACLHALDHHVERLADDHDNARVLAQALSNVDGLGCDPAQVETNIVVFEVTSMSGLDFVALAAEQGVKLAAIDRGRVRAVTHLGVSAADIREAAWRLSSLI